MPTKRILPAKASGGTTPCDQAKARQRILLVDDEQLIRRLNSEALIYSGYEVATAEDGAAAWLALNADHYDLLVTDHEMPNLNGVELLKKVHAAKLPLLAVMVTKRLPTWAFAQHPWLLPAALLLKPFTFEELLRAVKAALRAPPVGRAELAAAPHWQNLPSVRTATSTPWFPTSNWGNHPMATAAHSRL